jgi:hypothetical protein
MRRALCAGDLAHPVLALSRQKCLGKNQAESSSIPLFFAAGMMIVFSRRRAAICC